MCHYANVVNQSRRMSLEKKKRHSSPPANLLLTSTPPTQQVYMSRFASAVAVLIASISILIISIAPSLNYTLLSRAVNTTILSRKPKIPSSQSASPMLKSAANTI